MSKKKIILCADDFGISNGVSRGILQLLQKGRLSAVSCMSLGEAWPECSQELKSFSNKASIGLHITLTYLRPLNKEIGTYHPPEKELFFRTWLCCIDKQKMRREIQLQFENFIDLWGKAPDFIDGHQHVHILPVIRDIVLELRQKHAPHSWVRNVVDFTLFKERKRQILAILGWRFQQQLKIKNIKYNKQIFGFYDHQNPKDFSVLMDQWIEKANNNGVALIHCHPGFPDESLRKIDNVFQPRQNEFDFLNSDVFGEWLEKRIVLVQDLLSD